MPFLPGLLAMPTVLANAAFSMVPDRSRPVRGPDRLAVVSPMYNEESGAGRALTSLLRQRRAPDEIALSINGSTDRTYEVVVSVLRDHGYRRVEEGRAGALPARLERWYPGEPGPVVVVVRYARQTAKSEAINNLLASDLLTAERWLLVDGDTVFDPGFLAAIADNFYRLRPATGAARAAGVRWVLEDYALQSGSVTSFLPAGARGAQRFISAARSAEYAFSGLLRQGQVRTLGGGPVFGASRLFTVVGCGFAARRDAGRVPCDTITEDHDLTLAVQSRPTELERVTAATLSRRGFRLVQDGVERDPLEVFDRDDVIEVRRSGNARFVGEAVMYTEDPPHLPGYLTQIDRWNGGGLQNAFKRMAPGPERRTMSANVRWIVYSSQVEDVLGLLLLLLFPTALALTVGGSPMRVPLRALGAWVGFDLLATLVLTFLGFVRFERGARGGPAWPRALGRTLACSLPFLSLKYLNPLSYLSAMSQVLPTFVRERRERRVRGSGGRGRDAGHRERDTQGVAWQRPTVGRLNGRTAGVAASMVAVCLLVFVGVLQLTPSFRPGTGDTWALVYRSPRYELERHVSLPIAVSARLPLRAGASTAPDTGPARSLVAVSDVTPLERDLLAAAPAGDAGPAADARVAAPSARPAVVTDLAGAVARLDPAAAVAAARDPSAPAVVGMTLSRYCRPAWVAGASTEPLRLGGDPGAYTPLSNWQLLMLARLAPLAPLVEQAATAYDLPPRYLLQVLVNESYLDPLAVGKTGDKGLSQMTSDALTLVGGVSHDPTSPLHNDHLVAGDFSVFDPDFSICGGAAKLAWALWHVGAGENADADARAKAYALYINPLEGLDHGQVSERHRPAVEAMQQLSGLLDRLDDVYAAYRLDPASVAPRERALVEISAAVADGSIDLPEAYRRTYGVVRDAGVDDTAMYQAVLDRLFPSPRASAPTGGGL